MAIPTLKYLVRSGRLRKTQGFFGTLLQIKPLISIDAEGRIVEAGKVIGRKRLAERSVELALAHARRLINPRFIVAHMLAPELAVSLRRILQQEFAEADIPILEASPALGLHVGVGAIAIAIMGDPLPE
ncbi:MAG: DegV domain-containing protein [bacterium ADurb.Bin431]|nr:MAG: DegV domain-containing protein [bacterium ADurb.Bin431]